jgi:hypothetical protein
MNNIMISTLTKLLVAIVPLSLMVIACDMPKSAKMNSDRSVEFVENKGNMRCVSTDGQEFCASSRMREPIEKSPIAVL